MKIESAGSYILVIWCYHVAIEKENNRESEQLQKNAQKSAENHYRQ